jgi:hypothetical protein
MTPIFDAGRFREEFGARGMGKGRIDVGPVPPSPDFAPLHPGYRCVAYSDTIKSDASTISTPKNSHG